MHTPCQHHKPLFMTGACKMRLLGQLICPGTTIKWTPQNQPELSSKGGAFQQRGWVGMERWFLQRFLLVLIAAGAGRGRGSFRPASALRNLRPREAAAVLVRRWHGSLPSKTAVWPEIGSADVVAWNGCCGCFCRTAGTSGSSVLAGRFGPPRLWIRLTYAGLRRERREVKGGNASHATVPSA